MHHILIVDLPGGDDADILTEALAGGDRFTFLTGDAAHYRGNPAVAPLLANAVAVIDVPGFDPETVMTRVLAAHEADPYDAIMCLQDLRLVETALIAARLGLRHLSPACAALCRDKAAVRHRLASAGIAQPGFAEVDGNAPDGGDVLVAAVERLGLPVIIKPVDGFGSNHVFALRGPDDMAILRNLSDLVARGPGDYGLGVTARGRLLVERLIEGPVVGCDTMSVDGRHVLLGIHEKLFFPPPSFAIRGGCFTANAGQFDEIEAYLFRLLDAVGFDNGATHIELAMTGDGPMLIEINPRLVGARIARVTGAALGQSIHRAMITLHADGRLPVPTTGPGHAATRWIAATGAGLLTAIDCPGSNAPAFVGLASVKRPGEYVRPPLDNADRLGCVITRGHDRAAIEALAERIVAETRVQLRAAA